MAFVFIAAPVFSHPHIWVDSGLELVVEGNTVKGFWAEWTFDDMMTAMVLADAPAGANGRFSDASTRKIRDGYFQNLANYQYFCYIWQDDRVIPITTVSAFETRLSGGKLYYRFFIPINRTIPTSGTVIRISMYDETYYTDLGFRRVQPIRVTGAGPGRFRFSLIQNPSRAYFGEQIYPEEAVITLTGSP